MHLRYTHKGARSCVSCHYFDLFYRQSGIFLITNKVNSNSFIGKSRDLFSDLTNLVIPNFFPGNTIITVDDKDTACSNYVSTSIYNLHKNLLYYNHSHFTFSVVKFCSYNHLDSKERFFIKKLNQLKPNNHFYN